MPENAAANQKAPDWLNEEIKNEQTICLSTLCVNRRLKSPLAAIRQRTFFSRIICSKYSDYVCVNEIGELIRPRTLSDNFKIIIKKNNIRNLRLYDCRHTAASIMLKNGVSMKQIQMILGHSDYATTANIYSHLDYADKVSATKEMKNILYGNE